MVRPVAALVSVADPGPEFAGQETFGATGAAKLPVGLLQARKAAELLQLADRRHLGMGVEHQVEQRRAAMAQARDEDDLHHAPLPAKPEPTVLMELPGATIQQLLITCPPAMRRSIETPAEIADHGQIIACHLARELDRNGLRPSCHIHRLRQAHRSRRNRLDAEE